ncbi:MAG: sensor histidine kinase [Acidobacteria bacterium]|nr:sensor histidine kinase [Acidobacteriota bacterium]MBV9069595.1 sensor histidine kinase [Acidobacteriota bacterium]MBV9186798.1 sensor histidine kinase [Acidobacteriota bacterium]
MNVNEQKMKWVGVLTWIIIGIPSVLWQAQYRSLAGPRAALLFTAFIIFIVAFIFGTRPGCGTPTKISMVVVETLAAYVCVAMQPTGFQPVLLVMIAAQLGAYRPRVAIIVIAINCIVLGVIVSQTDASPVIYALVYFAFSLFSLFSMHVAHSEMEARKSLAEANAELRMTTELLEISSRTSERLRIARDLHDLLGHHLTALSLNLEVAGHLASGDAKESIEKSKSIAKHLLADVRDVVSRLRNDEPVDLTSSLESLRDVIVTPSLHLDFPRELAVADANIAEVALRTVQEIVTNAVRHSGARNLWLNLGTADHTLSIDARDDGVGADNVTFGNGLLGLRERVQQARGTFEVTSMRGRGFSLHVTLPLGAAA